MLWPGGAYELLFAQSVGEFSCKQAIWDKALSRSKALGSPVMGEVSLAAI